MVNTKGKTRKKFHLVTRVLMPETLETLPHGETVTLEVAKVAPYNTIVCAVLRKNKEYGHEEFSYVSSMNGAVVTVKRADAKLRAGV